jgi:ATP-dependent Clp protease protease subunit
VFAGLGIYDMQYIKPDVATIVQEWQLLWDGIVVCRCSRKTFCFATFKSNDSPTIRRSKELRLIWKSLREMLKLKDELYKIISQHSGQTFDKVHKDSERDYWMIAEEAKNTE